MNVTVSEDVEVPPPALECQIYSDFTFRGLCELLFGDSPLLHGEVLPSGPDHVRVNGGPVHAEQVTGVTAVVRERRLLQDIPHLKRRKRCSLKSEKKRRIEQQNPNRDGGLTLTWAVPSYETVTSRASW